MKAQLSLISARVGSNPSTLKIVSMVVFLTVTVVGMVAPAFAGPISGPVDVF